MVGCPFYGCRWPERSPLLHVVGGNECGLDLECHGACVMEVQGRHVDYFACPVALDHHSLLEAAKHVIQFDSGGGPPQFLADWECQARR